MQILSSASAGGGEEPALDIEAVQAQLRGALLKLQYSDAYLRKLPAGCSFEVAAYTTAARGSVGSVPLAEWAEEQAGPGHLELRQVGGWGDEWRRVGEHRVCCHMQGSVCSVGASLDHAC